MNCEIEDGAPHDKTRYNPGSAQTRGFDPSQADHDEWAVFPYPSGKVVEVLSREEAALGRAARARIVHTTSASIRAAKNGALGAALGDKTAGQQ